MRISVIFFIIFYASLASAGRLAYKSGHCEISLSNLIREIVHSELYAALNPKFRYSNEKLLRFDLYTPKNPNERQILITGDKASLKRSNFNRNWPVRFSIHGWMGNGFTCSNAAIKDAYLSRGDFNVIIVDWSAHALDVSYTRISDQLSTFARHLVKFIDFLHIETGIAYEQIYLIGHSAGAHISGWAGKMLKPKKLGAIMGLDPAGLAQLGLSESHRLAPNDAIYVESIHTDIALLGNPSTNLSQAAFFPNWGLGQAHCPNATAAEFDFVCDHFASIYYFAESIRNPLLFGSIHCEVKGYLASKGSSNFDDFKCSCPILHAKNGACAAEVYFGGEPLIRKSGVFYFSTKKEPAFGYGGSSVYIREPQPSNFLRSRVRTGKVFTPNAFFKISRKF